MEEQKPQPEVKRTWEYVGTVQGKRSEGMIHAKTEAEAAEHLRRLGVQQFSFKTNLPKPPNQPAQPIRPQVPPQAPQLPHQIAPLVQPISGAPQPPVPPKNIPNIQPNNPQQQMQAKLAAQKAALIHNHSCTCGCHDVANIAKQRSVGVLGAELQVAEQNAARKVAGRRQTVIVGAEKVAIEKVNQLLAQDGVVVHASMSPTANGTMCFLFVVEHD